MSNVLGKNNLIQLGTNQPFDVFDEELYNLGTPRETHANEPIYEVEHILPLKKGRVAGFLNFSEPSNVIVLSRPENIHIRHRGRFSRGRHVISSRIAEALRSSRSILDLEDNWDDEGSPRYSETTWDRATKFIRDTAIQHWKSNSVWVKPPRIMPGPSGSIDVHWKTQSRELLINIPADKDAAAGYYGSGGPNDTIKGKLDTSSSNEWILMWLLR